MRALWQWLNREEHRGLLRLWAQAYVRSLLPDAGPWADFAAATVRDWLAVLLAAARADDVDDRVHERPGGADDAEATLALAVLRGALLDLLATGDVARTTSAVEVYLASSAIGGR